MKKKCLIADEMHQSILELIAQIGFEPTYLPKISRTELIEKIGDFEGLIIRSKTDVDKEVLDKAQKLEFICRAGAGLDKIDVQYAESKGIEILNAPEGNRDALAEHAMAILLNLLNNVNRADKEVRNWIWNREANRGVELSDKTVGIIGFGNMGQAFVQRLRSFGPRILVYDKYIKGFGTRQVEETNLDKIFDKADILSVHIPLNPETKAWMNEGFFNKFRKDIYLLNTARGEIIPLKSIVNLLDSGKLLGVALDVLEKEKFDHLTDDQRHDFENLFARENVVLSPHVGGWTHASYRRINEVLIGKIANHYKIEWDA